MKAWAVLLFVLGGLVPAGAQIRTSNPGFAPRESYSYVETIGGQTRPYQVTLTLVGEGPSARYEFHTVGTDLESVYRLDPATLVSLSSQTLTKAPDAEVVRTAEYKNVKVKAGADELAVTDLGSLPAQLRGYPWGKVAAGRIAYVGNASASASITFELQVAGKDKVAAAGKTWECWHVTLGLGGALSVFLAKTEYWFAVEGTHPLIKAAGPSAGPGSPPRSLVLQSFTDED